MTDLTDRMRTCAAHIASMTGVKEGSDPDANQTLPSRLVHDAVDLLVEASNIIEPIVAQTLAAVEAQKLHPSMSAEERTKLVGELWEMIPEKPPARRAPGPRDCPGCGNQEPKRADVVDRRIMLTCPQCQKQWLWRPHAQWG